uniref:Uncharacterized protein n=1 Tax=Physcomitrium patens TaxID=3218 RepID=A0A2K1K9N8_PHYPA|nr:hypothetical protein PHYPA_009684 [Physcomitrium patens]
MVVFFMNYSSTTTNLNLKIPYYGFIGKKPSFTHIRIFDFHRIRTYWIFKKKLESNGKLMKLKIRLFACTF